MKKVFYVIKDAFKNIDYKSKRTWVLFGLLIMIGFLSSLYASYGYYLNSGTKNVVISGTASFGGADLTLQIYLQDRDSSGNAIANSYSRVYYIPQVNYTYESAKTVCGNGITLTYDSTNYEFTINSTQKGICKVYFAAEGTVVPNATFELNVEQSVDSNKYVKMGSLPNNDYIYEINTTKTVCTDPNAELSISKRKILVTTSMDLDCTIYVDVQSITGGKLYTVSFDPNGGEVTESSIEAVSGEEYGTLPTPTKNGYTFDGWYTAASGGTKIENTTIASLSADQTLYAHWTSQCFVAGTKVKTINGFKNIEDIKVGDYVYAIDFDNNIYEYRKVTNTITSQTDELYNITINGEVVSASPRHQFYVVDKGWIRAYDLVTGDRLITSNKEKMIITHINHQINLDPIPTYNLTVDGIHTYLVSKTEILVHNANTSPA